MFETAKERVNLLKTDLSESEIEKLYIEHNNFKIIRTPILFEVNEFEVDHSIYKKIRQTKSIPVFGFFVLALALFIPIFTLFIALVLVLFVPPIFAFALIFKEGISIISNELNRQTMPVKKTLVLPI